MYDPTTATTLGGDTDVWIATLDPAHNALALAVGALYLLKGRTPTRTNICCPGCKSYTACLIVACRNGGTLDTVVSACSGCLQAYVMSSLVKSIPTLTHGLEGVLRTLTEHGGAPGWMSATWVTVLVPA